MAVLVLLLATACSLVITEPQQGQSSDQVQLIVQMTAMAIEGRLATEQAMLQKAGESEEEIQRIVEMTAMAIEGRLATEQAAKQPQPAQPTQPPQQAQPTAAPPQPTAPPPTAAIGSGAPEGSLTRAAYDPAAGYGPAHDYDGFDRSSGLWSDSNDGASRSWHSDGKYHIAFSSRGLWTWYWTNLDERNYYADVVIINGDKCVPADSAGMVFRGWQGGDWGYMFGITCGGGYFIGITGGVGDLGPVCSIDITQTWPFSCTARRILTSNLIATGPGAINRVGILASGGEFSFYINGQYVDGFNMYALPSGYSSTRGNFALYLGSAQKPDARVSFEEFSLWHLP